MAFRPTLLLLSIFSLSIRTTTQQLPNSTIHLGSSLSPTASPWLSPSGLFAFGFFRHQNDNTFAVGVFIPQPKTTPTVVWTANRDDSPVSSDATLELTPEGELLLRPNDEETRLVAASASRPARSASMLDSGNFVLYDSESRVVWESFGSPTDTILGGQNLTSGKQLVSSKSLSDRSSGRFWLGMQEDGNVVAYPANSSVRSEDSYWASGLFGFTTDLCLNLNGSLFLLGKNDTGDLSRRVIAVGSSVGGGTMAVIHRATFDPDGVLRLYSHEVDGERSRVVLRWEALKNRCDVKGFCGFNSFCAAGASGSEAACHCFPGFEYLDPAVTTLGCYQNFGADNCRADTEAGLTRYNISSSFENVTWNNYPYSVLPLIEELCRKSCLDDCNCWAVLYTPGICKKYKLPLRYGTRDDKHQTTTFFKAVSGGFDAPNHDPLSREKPVVTVKTKSAPILILALSLGSVALLCFTFAVSSVVVYKRRAYQYKKLSDSNLGLADYCILRSFTYEELERATEGFAEELGRGGFGAVYKGNLPGGSQTIAVKRLEKVVEEGIREFRAEMTTIARTHHKNLVQLIGFCTEGSKKLLVYEFMSNGSLADRLFKSATRPCWRERVKFVLDVARGVLYLHQECGVHIIHSNLKPQNILLDENWTAKISDFGLARLTMPNQAKMSEEVEGGAGAGYFAPEWKKNALISTKSDVYSFGIVLLETVCCRRNLEAKFSAPDEIILSDWVYRCFVSLELRKLVGDHEEIDMATLERLVKVGLWCIQDEPARRPPMKNVILMLEGTMDIPVPPSPQHSFASS